MKILYCAPEATNPNHYGYGNIRASFLRLGITLVDFDYLAETAALGKEGMAAKLEALIEAERPDIFYHAIIEDELPRDLLLRLKARPDLVTMVFFSDDDWRLPHSLQWVGYYDVATTNDSDALPVYQAHGHHHVRHVQYAGNPGVYYPRPVDKKYDVTFVGAAYPGRPQVVKALLDRGIDVRVWGPGWERYPELRAVAGGPLPTEVMIETICASRIVLGFAWCSDWTGTGPKQPQIKGRTFEYPACGAFQITLEDARLAAYFEPGKEIVTFRDDDDLAAKIRYYLAHDDEREAIAEAGMRRVLAAHTWEHRWTTFFTELAARPPEGKRVPPLPAPARAPELLDSARPLVSVITYVYNIAEYLDELIRSVQAQTFADFEFVIIDDGSTDHTREVVSAYLDDPRIRYFRQENIGKSGRFDLLIKAAMDRARGELIAFIGGDDVCAPQRLERQVEQFQSDPDLDIVHSNGSYIDPDSRPIAGNFDLPQPYNAWDMTRILFARNLVAHPTVMMRRRCFARIGPFEEGFAADFHYWLKSARFLKYRYLDEKLVSYRIHPKSSSMTQEGLLKAAKEAMRLVREVRPQIAILDLYPEIRYCWDTDAALGAAYLDFGNSLLSGGYRYPDLAWAEYQRALEHAPGTHAVFHNMAIALYLNDNVSDSERILKDLCEAGFAPAKESLALCQQRQLGANRLIPARDLYPELFEIQPPAGSGVWTHDGALRDRPFRILLIDDWRQPNGGIEALQAYARAFTPDDRAVLYVPTLQATTSEVEARILSALEDLGIDPGACADMEIVEVATLGDLPGSFDAVIPLASLEPLPRPLSKAPKLESATPDSLRAARAGKLGMTSAKAPELVEPVGLKLLVPVLNAEDAGGLPSILATYLAAASATDPVTLIVWFAAGMPIDGIHAALDDACRMAGIDPQAPFADIEATQDPGHDPQALLSALEESDLLLVRALDPELARLASGFDLPMLEQPDAEQLRTLIAGWNPRAVDIVLLTHNRLEYLRRTVDALVERTSHPFRLTIVDNASDLDVLAYLDANRARFHRVIRNAENRWTEAFTQGIAVSRSDPFIVSDPDILVPELEGTWLERMLLLMEKHPEVGMLALNLDPSNKPPRLPDVYVSQKKPYGRDITLSNVGTVMQTIRRRYFQPPYTTDWETVEAIRAAGGLVGFANHLVAYHLGWDEERDYPEHLVKKFHYFHDHYGSTLYNRYTDDAQLLEAMASKSQVVPKTTQSTDYYGHSRPEIQALIPASAERILDVGCAGGALGRALKERQACHVTGIEYVPEVAQRARQHLDEVHVGDALAAMVSMREGQFDCIIFADVLEHLVDPYTCLAEAKRLLSPGGIVVASIPNVSHWSVVKNLLEGRWDYQDEGILDRTHLRFFTRSSMVRMFEEAGFDVSDLSGIRYGDMQVPQAVVQALAGAGIDTSRLALEGQAYQYLVTAVPQRKGKTRGLTSIVMLTWNQLPYTKLCVESLFENTTEPFELVIVDNGSTDGTVEYLRALAAHYAHVKIALNAENRGFAGGCNQGLALSSGDYVLLLNNDTVVAKGWLSGMIRGFEHEGVGIVGPRTNSIIGPQLVKPVPYDIGSLEGFAEYADQWRVEHQGQYWMTPRVIGFCMLIRREVLDRLGGLDTSFGKGNFEDDDFCLRAQVAGFKIAVADEVFIHHFGSVTFRGQNIDYRQAMEENWAKFKRKWLLSEDLPMQNGYSFKEALSLPFDPARHTEPVFSRAVEPAALPDARGYNVVVTDRTRWAEVLEAYLEAFEPGADVALHLFCGADVAGAQQEVLDQLARLGKDPERIPDVSLLAGPSCPLEVPRYLAAAQFVVASGPTALGARDMGLPVVEAPDAETLRIAHEHFGALSWDLAPLAMEGTPRKRWLLSDPLAWEQAIAYFLQSAPNGTGLMIRVEPGRAEAYVDRLGKWLVDHGHDPEQIPDVILVDDPPNCEVAIFRAATAWLDTGRARDRAIARSLGLDRIMLNAPVSPER